LGRGQYVDISHPEQQAVPV